MASSKRIPLYQKDVQKDHATSYVTALNLDAVDLELTRKAKIIIKGKGVVDKDWDDKVFAETGSSPASLQVSKEKPGPDPQAVLSTLEDPYGIDSDDACRKMITQHHEIKDTAFKQSQNHWNCDYATFLLDATFSFKDSLCPLSIRL